jgi:hypothetical protein
VKAREAWEFFRRNVRQAGPSGERVKAREAWEFFRRNVRQAGPSGERVKAREAWEFFRTNRLSLSVRPLGFEPRTCGLRVRCSAIELEALAARMIVVERKRHHDQPKCE